MSDRGEVHAKALGALDPVGRTERVAEPSTRAHLVRFRWQLLEDSQHGATSQRDSRPKGTAKTLTVLKVARARALTGADLTAPFGQPSSARFQTRPKKSTTLP